MSSIEVLMLVCAIAGVAFVAFAVVRTGQEFDRKEQLAYERHYKFLLSLLGGEQAREAGEAGNVRNDTAEPVTPDQGSPDAPGRAEPAAPCRHCGGKGWYYVSDSLGTGYDEVECDCKFDGPPETKAQHLDKAVGSMERDEPTSEPADPDWKLAQRFVDSVEYRLQQGERPTWQGCAYEAMGDYTRLGEEGLYTSPAAGDEPAQAQEPDHLWVQFLGPSRTDQCYVRTGEERPEESGEWHHYVKAKPPLFDYTKLSPSEQTYFDKHPWMQMAYSWKRQPKPSLAERQRRILELLHTAPSGDDEELAWHLARGLDQ